MSNQASGGGEAMPFSGVGLTPDEETKVRAAALEPGDEELLVDWAHSGIGADWPRQYVKGKSQLERDCERARALAAQAAGASAKEHLDLGEGV